MEMIKLKTQWVAVMVALTLALVVGGAMAQTPDPTDGHITDLTRPATQGFVLSRSLFGVGAPTSICSSIYNNGAFYVSDVPVVYQCSNITGDYAWGAVAGSSGGGGVGPGTTGEIGYYAADGSALTATNAVIWSPLLPRLELGSPVDGSVTDGVSVWLNSNTADLNQGQIDVEAGAVSLISHGETATAGQINMHADTNLAGDETGGSVLITASSVDPANGGNIGLTATQYINAAAQGIDLFGQSTDMVHQADVFIGSNTGATNSGMLVGINNGKFDLTVSGGPVKLTSSGSGAELDITAPTIKVAGLTGIGTKAPLCVDTDGSLYLGNNSGTGAPCP